MLKCTHQVPLVKINKMLENNIKFICERELKVVFSSLIINVESIERLYPDGFKAFYLSDDFGGVTNGFLFLVAEMMSYPVYLYSLIDKLQPLGFMEGRDYVIGQEELTKNPDGSSCPPHPIPWCKKADWLQSIITSKTGNMVWHSSFDKGQKAFIGNIRDERPWTLYWAFWYDKHPVLRNYRFKKLNRGYPMFNLDESRYDVVDSATFGLFENSLIPFLIGSQFGINPRIEEAFTRDYIGYVAILGKSLLSGVVAGLMIYIVQDSKLGDKILSLKNNKGVNQKIDELFKSMCN